MRRSNRRIVFTAPQTVEVQQEEVSTDRLGPNELLIETLYSVVSAGTELACLAGGEAWFEGLRTRKDEYLGVIFDWS